MAKLLKIGSAVTEIEDIKIGTPEEIKEGTAKEAEPVSGEVDNSGNWTSITIGDTTASIPQGQSTIKQDAVDKLNAGILDAASIEDEGAERFSNDLYIDGNVYFESDINVTSNSLYLGEDDTQVAAIDDRVGQYVESSFKKFGYVEEVEFQGKGIGPGQAGVTVDTVEEDKLYVITINIKQIPEEYHFPTNIEGTILEIYSESQSNWYKPMWTYYDNETGYLKQFAFFFQCDPDGEDICKFRILK